MKKTKFCILSAMLIVVSTVMGQSEKTVYAKLEEATVFLLGAELTHTAEVSVTEGENQIIISGLSPRLDVSSLKVKSDRGLIIASYEFTARQMVSENQTSPVIKRINDSINFYKTEMERISIEKTIVSNTDWLLHKGIENTVRETENRLKEAELASDLKYYRHQRIELESEKQRLFKDSIRLITNLNRLYSEYDRERLKGSQIIGELKINTSSAAAGPVKLIVSYFTREAQWIPFYDVNINSTDSPVSFSAKAKVQQTTGMDWNNIRLTLSTAAPGNGKTAPLLSTWFLEGVLPEPPGVYARRGDRNARQNSYSYEIVDDIQMVFSGAASDDAVENKIYQYVAQSENMLNVTYDIDLPYSIPGNGKGQNIDLTVKEAPAIYKYYTIPKMDNEVYLLAEIPEWDKLGLLSGTANITYDGTYLGEAYIDASSTMDKLPLTLGTDKRISVKRERITDYSSTRTSGSDIDQTFGYRITVKNNQNHAVKIIIKDQYPVSTQKNIEVTLNSKQTTTWTANIEETGVVTWEEKFAPGKTKVYNISYSVKYPKNMNINL